MKLTANKIMIGLAIVVLLSVTGVMNTFVGQQAITPYVTYPCTDKFQPVMDGSAYIDCSQDEELCVNDNVCMTKYRCEGTEDYCKSSDDCAEDTACIRTQDKICMQPTCRTTISCDPANEAKECPKCFGKIIGKQFEDETAERDEVAFPEELAYAECAEDPLNPEENICYVSEYCLDQGKVKEWLNQPGKPLAWARGNPLMALAILAFVIFLIYAFATDRKTF